jgi:diadenosine tetraphosphatase ApaH/serine/threonine PP2A family protein phosphatase
MSKKLALFSDLHANLQAFTACLQHAKSLGISQFAFLGDLVGYGGQPNEVVDIVSAMVAEGALVVRGNHDQMAITPPTEVSYLGESTALWTHQQLGEDRLKFLKSLPLTVRYEDVLLVHASAFEPERWHYVDSERSAQNCIAAAEKTCGLMQVFVGHVHHQGLYYDGNNNAIMHFSPTPRIEIPLPNHRRWLATVGSVGQPRDRDPRAMYAIYDSENMRISFQRVSYDHATAADLIRKAGLPEIFATRLGVGQ